MYTQTQSVLPITASQMSDQWKRSISKIDRGIQRSMFVPGKLIVFAYEYAIQQSNELKNRFGSSVNQEEANESIFVNKISEIGYAMMLGYTQDSILNGRSPVSLDYRAKDERVFIDAKYASDYKRKLLISGTKKFSFPVIHIKNVSDQAIIYVDAEYNKTSDTSNIKIDNGSIKVTAIGLATPDFLNENQSKRFYMGYSNIYTSLNCFVGLFPFPSTANGQIQTSVVPKHVVSIIKSNQQDIDIKLSEIQKFFSRSASVHVMKKIDYAALFAGFI